MKKKSQDIETVLRTELAKQDFEFVKSSAPKAEGSHEVEAYKLHPVTGNKHDPLYVPVPVTMQVTLDDKNQIQKIEGGAPKAEAVNDAEHFVKTLIDNHQLGGLPDQPVANATHQVEVNDKGQRVIKRRNFSAY